MSAIWEDLAMLKEYRRGRHGGTHTVGEVCNQVMDFDTANLELAVEPVARRSVLSHGG